MSQSFYFIDCPKMVVKDEVPPRTAEKSKDVENNNTDKVADDATGQVPIPPDGGWGWVITFSSFMIGMIVDGIAFTFGFFFLEFQEYFGANKSVTSSINSVLTGSYLTVGTFI